MNSIVLVMYFFVRILFLALFVVQNWYFLTSLNIMLSFIFRRGHVHVAMLLLHAGSDFDIQVYNFVPLHTFKKC